MTIYEFVSKYNGKFIDNDKVYGAQCVDVVKQWIADNGWKMKSGNAIDWQNNGDDFYKWVKNTTSAVPSPGDIIVFSVGKYGHIGLVVSANVNTVDVFNQNWPHGNKTDPCVITRFNYISPKVVGWLHPKALDVVTPPPAPPEDPNLAKIRELEAIIQAKAQEIVNRDATIVELKRQLSDMNNLIGGLNTSLATQKSEYEKLFLKHETYVEDTTDREMEFKRILTDKEAEIERLKQAIKDKDLSKLSFWEKIIILFS
jgi:surface antigen